MGVEHFVMHIISSSDFEIDFGTLYIFAVQNEMENVFKLTAYALCVE